MLAAGQSHRQMTAARIFRRFRMTTRKFSAIGLMRTLDDDDDYNFELNIVSLLGAPTTMLFWPMPLLGFTRIIFRRTDRYRA